MKHQKKTRQGGADGPDGAITIVPGNSFSIFG